jgi:hypothetical protein
MYLGPVYGSEEIAKQMPKERYEFQVHSAEAFTSPAYYDQISHIFIFINFTYSTYSLHLNLSLLNNGNRGARSFNDSCIRGSLFSRNGNQQVPSFHFLICRGQIPNGARLCPM